MTEEERHDQDIEQPLGEPAPEPKGEPAPEQEPPVAPKASKATETPADPEPDAVPEIEEPPHPQYTVGDWNGYKHFQCNYCGYGVLDQPHLEIDGYTAIHDHIYHEHEKPTAPRPGSGLILDSNGNPIL